MQVSIGSIEVSGRVRKEIGDLGPLMESLQKYRQLSPVVITRKNELIAGHRRLLAAQKLGWYTIDAVCIDRDMPVEKLEMELEENVHRKDFTPSELLEGYARLEKLKKPNVFIRMRNFFAGLLRKLTGLFRKKRKRSSAPPPEQDEYLGTVSPAPPQDDSTR